MVADIDDGSKVATTPEPHLSVEHSGENARIECQTIKPETYTYGDKYVLFSCGSPQATHSVRERHEVYHGGFETRRFSSKFISVWNSGTYRTAVYGTLLGRSKYGNSENLEGSHPGNVEHLLPIFSWFSKFWIPKLGNLERKALRLKLPEA